jgi:hypothetical protein
MDAVHLDLSNPYRCCTPDGFLRLGRFLYWGICPTCQIASESSFFSHPHHFGDGPLRHPLTVKPAHRDLRTGSEVMDFSTPDLQPGERTENPLCASPHTVRRAPVRVNN